MNAEVVLTEEMRNLAERQIEDLGRIRSQAIAGHEGWFVMNANDAAYASEQGSSIFLLSDGSHYAVYADEAVREGHKVMSQEIE